ncbi:hypothetical protein JB92DRAFT_2989440 [Gautieria morchelliformis]|nr:hypothetical protein JB92DRAFT_2989440 [Gautieria morchelliformis]
MMISALATIFIFFSAVDSTTPSQHKLVRSTVTVGPPSNCTVARAVFQATLREACKSNFMCCAFLCCTTEYLQASAADMWCHNDPAVVQHHITERVTYCHSQGLQVDDVQLQLSPAQTDILNDLNHRDEQIRQKQTVFFAFQVAGGHIGLPLLALASILSRKVHRDPTFFNFCLTWIVSSVVFCVLLYHSTEGHTANLPHSGNTFFRTAQFTRRCFVQASLIPGVQAMTACSTAALVIQLWLRPRTAIYGVTISPVQSRLITIALTVAPWILLISISIAASYVNNARLGPNIFYCAVQLNSRSTLFLRAEYGIVLVILLVTLVWDVLLVKTMYLHWSAYRTKSAVSLSILLRVTAFSLFRVVIAIAYATVLFSTRILAKSWITASTGIQTTLISLAVPVWVDLSQAALPLVAFLVLGTTKETLATLTFWRTISKSRQTAPSEGDNRTYPLIDLQDTHPDVHANAERTVYL